MYKKIDLGGKSYGIYSIRDFDETRRLPYSLRILLENLIRYKDLMDQIVRSEHIDSLIARKKGQEIPFFPERVILQDFTGVPLITDIAVMRDIAVKFGKNPRLVNPIKRCDLVIDHSVQVDFFGTSYAFEYNTKKEFERNKERYEFLKWAQKSFKNIRVIPPGAGIIHQVNLEMLADLVRIERIKGKGLVLFPDTLLGTDSHTTMINSIGVLGWGVGGIEAEAVMLGEPNYIVVPEVIGVKLVGKPKDGITATDIVLTVTETLRKKNVVDKFVEFFGSGLRNLSIPDRATISNMSPEYGARCGFFPPDDETIRYLKITGRSKKHIMLVEAYLKENLLFYDGSDNIEFDDVVEIDLEKVVPSVAGPSRPHDRTSLGDLKSRFISYLKREKKSLEIDVGGGKFKVGDGSIILAAITSCTNTSNPYLMLGAGILAKNAVQRGLKIPPYVKTSNAPGSLVVKSYLEKSGLMPYLEALGFHITAYGCTVCIGNSGPINSEVEQAVKKENLVAVSVLSGNRNFEARIHPFARANFLMSPPLVVAFALAGRIDINLNEEPIGYDPNGNPVYLKDIWPKKEEIENYISLISDQIFKEKYSKIFEGTDEWKNLSAPDSDVYPWNVNSTYIKPPPFFENFDLSEPEKINDISSAKVLLILGDSITTDHISPAGNIDVNSPAGRYLLDRGIKPSDFNNYGARRGNWEVMVRGTFANIRLKNLMVDVEGGYTICDDKVVSVFEASEYYKSKSIPLIVIAGKEYGSGSSRDWAAKGTALLGVKAIIAESFETIHRSNLVEMGVVPLQFKDTNAKELGINGKEIFNIKLSDLQPQKEVEVQMIRENGELVKFKTTAKINAQVEVDYIKHGGILPYVMRKILGGKSRRKSDAG